MKCKMNWVTTNSSLVYQISRLNCNLGKADKKYAGLIVKYHFIKINEMQVLRKNNLGRGWLWGWLEVIARANLGNCNWAVATMLYILLSQS